MPSTNLKRAAAPTLLTVLAASLAALLLLILAACALTAEATWIDVRTADEYSEARVSQAINIPYEEIERGVAALGLERDQTIYLYCGSGRRAGIARDGLLAAGYSDVVNLGGLDDALDRAGQAAAD
jgi:phage shock protein E